MEKEPRSAISLISIGIGLISIGIGIGAVTILILLWVGARITGINLGVVEVGFPTQAIPVQQNPTQPPAQTVVVIIATPLPSIIPTEEAPIRQPQQPATVIATQELSLPTMSSSQITQQPTVTQPPAPAKAPRECSGQGFMPPIPAPPPQGCVLTVEWWYPPNPTSCGLWITYGAVEFDEGVVGYWWYEYDVTVPEHIRAFKEKYDYCEVKDFR